MMRRWSGTALALAAVIGGCATNREPPPPTIAEAGDYRLGAGDRLRVGVFGEERLSKEYGVGADGNVDIELVGPVKAVGRTTAEFAAAVTAAYANGFIKQPRVVAEVIAYRPFYVLGEVLKPGPYPYIPGLTLSQAVAIAGGFTYRARKSSVTIMRSGSADARTYRAVPGIAVLPGDTVTIPERHF